MEDFDSFLFKIILIGNSGVGKTCLAKRFIQGEFPINKSATIGVDFMVKPMIVDDYRVNLQLWDTAGQERFRAITQSYYRSAHCLILMYDISSQPSFDALPQWCRDIDSYTVCSIDGSSDVLKVLIGNKSDKYDVEIPTIIGENFAKMNDFQLFFETSSLETNEKINDLFKIIAQNLIEIKLSKMSDLEKSQNRIIANRNQRKRDGGDNGGNGGNGSSADGAGGSAGAGGGLGGGSSRASLDDGNDSGLVGPYGILGWRFCAKFTPGLSNKSDPNQSDSNQKNGMNSDNIDDDDDSELKTDPIDLYFPTIDPSTTTANESGQGEQQQQGEQVEQRSGSRISQIIQQNWNNGVIRLSRNLRHTNERRREIQDRCCIQI